jgi:cobalt-zinc-cadmium efflux system membrane fusion protein
MNDHINILARARAAVGKKQLIAMIVLLALGALGAAAILGTEPGKPADEHGHGHGEADGHADEHGHGGHEDGHDDHPDETAKGPHGGQMHADGDVALEVLIAEQGGEPRLKLWLTNKGQPVALGTIQAGAELTRPGGDVEKLAFAVEKDALVSTTAVAEPHVFEGLIELQTPAEPYLFPISHSEGVVSMSDAQMKAAGVTLDSASPAQIRSTLELPGEIGFNEDRTAHVVPRVSGVVEAVPVSLGQSVTKGQVLAVISSAQVSEQRSELQAAQKRLQLARSTHEREKKLFDEKISPQQDVLQAEQTLREAEIAVANAQQKLGAVGASPQGASLNRFELRAPFDGVVVEKHIALGEQVKEDANVFTISDLRMVWAQLSVPAKDLPLVRVGGRVTVRSTAFDQSAAGTVAYVGSLIGEQTRTAQARVALANPQMAWRPGLFVNVEVTAGEDAVPVTVAADAVQSIEEQAVVFLRSGGGFVPQPVQVGRSDGKRVEIVKGLKAGSRYAAGGAFVVKSEAGKASATHSH